MNNPGKSTVVSFLIICLSAWGAGDSKAQQIPDYKNPDLPVEKRIADLVDRMTLEEKCYQVTGNSVDYNQEALTGNERLGIPAFIIVHGPYGGKFKRTPQMQIGTYFPVSIAMAATWSEDMVQEITTAMGEEMNADEHHPGPTHGQELRVLYRRSLPER
jgi:beta-glucosidase